MCLEGEYAVIGEASTRMERRDEASILQVQMVLAIRMESQDRTVPVLELYYTSYRFSGFMIELLCTSVDGGEAISVEPVANQ
jgi:hypothetical protein